MLLDPQGSPICLKANLVFDEDAELNASMLQFYKNEMSATTNYPIRDNPKEFISDGNIELAYRSPKQDFQYGIWTLSM